MPKKAFASVVVALPLSLAVAPASADAPPGAELVSKDSGRASVQPRHAARATGSSRRAGYRRERWHRGYHVHAWHGPGAYSRRHYFVDGLPLANPFGSGVGVLHGGWGYYSHDPVAAWYPYSHGDHVVWTYPRPIYRPVCPCY